MITAPPAVEHPTRRTGSLGGAAFVAALAMACGGSTPPTVGPSPDAAVEAAADANSPADVDTEADVVVPDTAPGTGETLTALDIPYPPPPGADDGLATLDLYWRDGAPPGRLVVLVHGGSWVGGDKSNFASAAPDFVPWWLDRGFVVAAVNFRLASKLGKEQLVRPTDQARDVAHALAWLDDHGTEYGVGEPGVVACGYSSGAHLVALLGADSSYLAEVGLPADHLVATVSLDVHAYDVPYALSLMPGSVVEDNIPLILHLFGATKAEQLAASPIHHLDDGAVPALLLSTGPGDETLVGSHGYIVSLASARYRDALEAAGVQAGHHHYPDETHGSLAVDFGAAGDTPTAATGLFLDDVSK